MSDQHRFRVIAAGFTGDDATARASLDHRDAPVRASALRALHRMGTLDHQTLGKFVNDEGAEVRRTVAELSAGYPDVQVVSLIDDSDVFVAEMAAWSLGERDSVTVEEMDVLIDRTTSHPQVLVREACAASLGSIGDPRGLPAILAACTDKPTVRRRAVLALAPFDGPEVDQALRRALDDADWQVRQNAEDLVTPRS